MKQKGLSCKEAFFLSGNFNFYFRNKFIHFPIDCIIRLGYYI